MSCAERRELCRQFIERIEVFPEEQKDGRILKSIAFRFPVFYGEDEAAGEPELPDETVAFVLDCRKLPVHRAGGESNLCGDQGVCPGKDRIGKYPPCISPRSSGNTA